MSSRLSLLLEARAHIEAAITDLRDDHHETALDHARAAAALIQVASSSTARTALRKALQ